MTLRAKVRGELRNVSKAMARRLLARGVPVQDTARPPAPPSPPAPDSSGEQSTPAVNADQSAAEQLLIDPSAVADGVEKFLDRQHVDAEKVFAQTQLVDASQTLRIEFKDSKNVASAALDTTSGIVTVTFTNGKNYRFANFTSDLMAEWNAAESAGKWFTANVRKSERHPQVEAPKE